MDIISRNILVEELQLACPNCRKDKDIEKLNTFQFQAGKSRKKISSTSLERWIIKGEQCERSTEITIGEITIGEITILTVLIVV